MSQQIIGIGAAPDDGTGDPLRTAFAKTNANFGELYPRLPGVHPGYVSQRWYGQARSSAGNQSVGTTANVIHFAPLFVFGGVTLDRVGVKTGTTNAVSGNAILGLYDTANGAPNELVANFGSIAIPAAANTNLILNADLTLEPGVYWFATLVDAAAQMTGGGTESWNIAQFGTTNGAAWFAGTSLIMGYSSPRVFGLDLPAAPAPLTSLTAAVPGGVFRVL